MFRSVCALALLCAAGTASAFPSSPEARAYVFADCAGRFRALAEHAEDLGSGAASENARLREAFADLLDAVAPFAFDAGLPPGQLVLWRANGHADQRTLLTQLEHAADERLRRPARNASRARIAQCKALVPSS